jgi:hypothetical protein
MGERGDLRILTQCQNAHASADTGSVGRSANEAGCAVKRCRLGQLATDGVDVRPNSPVIEEVWLILVPSDIANPFAATYPPQESRRTCNQPRRLRWPP